MTWPEVQFSTFFSRVSWNIITWNKRFAMLQPWCYSLHIWFHWTLIRIIVLTEDPLATSPLRPLLNRECFGAERLQMYYFFPWFIHFFHLFFLSPYFSSSVADYSLIVQAVPTQDMINPVKTSSFFYCMYDISSLRSLSYLRRGWLRQ
jgi:hypothetical protein